MKKAVIIVILLFSSLSYGQDYALWLISKDYYDKSQDLKDYYKAYYKDSKGKTVENPSSKIHTIKANELPLKIGFENVKEWRVPWGNDYVSSLCYKKESLERNKYEYFIIGIGKYQSYDDCLNTYAAVPNGNICYQLFSVILPHYIQPKDNTRKKQNRLFRTSKNTFTAPIKKIPEIKWQYNYNNKGFKDFPKGIRHNFPMKSTLEEILTNETIVPNTYLRVKAVLKSFSCGVSKTLESDELSFYIIPSSPQLKEVKGIATTCSYGQNGSFNLKLDRQLDNEELVITLYKQNLKDPNDFSEIPQNGQQFTTSLIPNSDKTFSYIWPRQLLPGNYKLKYQTHTGRGGIPATDTSWESLEKTKQSFNVGSSKSVTFNIGTPQDETCFNSGDGYIDISADGESNRTFEYQYYKNDTLQNTQKNKEGWIPFTNAKTTRLSGLSKANYQLKVRDSEKCMAKVPPTN